ncbi:HNH endonuclease signature motif containing protein, partial [Mycobacterium sp. NPDC003449]
GSQVHHAVTDWADGGNTNIDELALACGPDNRLVHTDGGYTTTINARGDVEWHPPPQLDHGQHRINYHHRPELLLAPPEDAPEPAPDLNVKPNSRRAPEPDLKWDSRSDTEWDPQRDNNFHEPPTPIPPNVDHLWDPQAVDPGLPPGWILLDPTPPPVTPHQDTLNYTNPQAPQPTDHHALTGKGVRGP